NCDHLRENAVDGFGMDEGDLEAEHAVPRRLVDQLGARLREVRKGSADVLDLVGNVVHPGPALRQETADRRVLAERAQKLEPALADADGRSLDALRLHTRALLEPCAEEALVRIERAVEILDRETDMVHGAGHRAGRLHVAIVFERLAPTMRVSALALVVTAAFLAGCGSSQQAAPPN